MKTISKLVTSLSFASIAVLSLTGCNLLKGLEKSCDVEFVGGDPFTTTHVSTFANGLTPHVSSEEMSTHTEYKFFGWTALNPSDVHFADENFDSEYVSADGIVRYNDIKEYITDGKVTMYPLFISRDELPVYYLVVGWYAKTSTSGLDTGQIENWTKDLKKFLVDECQATQDNLDNVMIRAYNGDVATIGGLINADGDVDILLGVGNNINSTGGVDIIEKQGEIMMGGKSRYIARLTDRPVVNSVYSWLKTDEGHASLA